MERKTPAPSFRVPAPTAGLVAGARPVVGAIGACGLMLLACSWFAFGAGGLSPFHRDVGSTDSVRIQAPASAAVAPAHKAPTVTATPNRHAPTRFARAPQPASGRPTPAPARPAAPELSKPAAAPAQATAPTPAPTQTQVQPAPTPPPALPAPLDNVPLPTVSVPPISVPALPTVTVQVPVLPTTTLPLGLP